MWHVISPRHGHQMKRQLGGAEVAETAVRAQATNLSIRNALLSFSLCALGKKISTGRMTSRLSSANAHVSLIIIVTELIISTW